MTDENKAKEEQNELDNLMDVFFNNMKAEVPPVDDIGVDTPMINIQDFGDTEEKEEEKEIEVELDLESEEPTVEESTDEEVEITEEEDALMDDIEVSEEEIFLVHGDGQITSEAEEKDSNNTVTEVASQSLVERAVINKAVNNVYDELISYMEFSEENFKAHCEKVGGTVLRNFQDELDSQATYFKHQLMLTKFSRYKEVPLDDVSVDAIEDEDLRHSVNQEVERLITQMIGGLK